MQKIEYLEIQNHLRKYRKLKGLTQKEVTNILGLINTGRISCWEQGTSMPTLMNCIDLSALYGTMMDALYIDFVRERRAEILQKAEKQMIERNIAKGLLDS